MSGVSNAEISRIEKGIRRTPSPFMLKAIAPHLGVSCNDLFKQAGFTEEIIDHGKYTESIFVDTNGNLADIIKKVKDIYGNDARWADIAHRVSVAGLSEMELDIIKAQTESLLEQFLKNKK